MEWITQNKEWIFSGIGVFIIGLIFAVYKKQKFKKNKQKSGANSTNIQIGRDFINKK